MNDKFYEKYTSVKLAIEAELDRLVVPDKDCKADSVAQVLPEHVIYESMRYSLLAGGKRIRPVLMMAVGELLGVDQDIVMPFACALEMIHTYSLIHDDLPAMDDDVLRRGKDTNHVVYGEDIAILAGDGLLNMAYEVMSEALIDMEDKQAGAYMMSGVAACSGVSGMVGGQVIDLQSEGQVISKDTLLRMHTMKTGALMKAACTTPALFFKGKNTSDEDFNLMCDFARNLGLAFQIKDDILDVKGDEAVLGKSIGKDKNNEKTTFLTFYTIEECESLLDKYTNAALSALEKYGAKADFLRDICVYLVKRVS